MPRVYTGELRDVVGSGVQIRSAAGRVHAIEDVGTSTGGRRGDDRQRPMIIA